MTPCTDAELNALLTGAIAQAIYYEEKVYKLFKIMYATGCRSAEAMTFDTWEYSYSTSRFTFQTVKTGVYRSIVPMAYQVELIEWHEAGNNKLQEKSYSGYADAWLWCIKPNIAKLEDKQSQLHTFRHYYARRKRELGNTYAQIAANMAITQAVAQNYVNTNIYII